MFHKIITRFRNWRYNLKFLKLTNNLLILEGLASRGKPSGILFAIGSLGPGGAERQLVATATGLVARGYSDVFVVCSSLKQKINRFFLPNLQNVGIDVSDLEEQYIDNNSELTNLISKVKPFIPFYKDAVVVYIKKIFRHRPLIVHLWLDTVNIQAGIAAVILKVPKIILGLRSLPPNYYHGNYSPKELSVLKSCYRWLARQTNVKLVSNSYACARAYERWLGIAKGQVCTIHNGFIFEDDYLESCRSSANEYRASYALSSTDLVIGTVIRFTDEKRPFLWLEIAAEVRRRIPSAKFLLVGDGPLRRDLELRAQIDDLNGVVIFTGIEAESLRAIAAMDIFLLTSKIEGLPNVLIEAQAIGIPVLTTDAGGAREAIQDKITGWVLNSDDVIDISDQIVRILRNKSWIQQSRLAMPAFVHEKFGLERMVSETLKLYAS